jgi:hypothetical protein
MKTIANTIFTHLFIHNDEFSSVELNSELKQELGNLAHQPYRHFKKTLTFLDHKITDHIEAEPLTHKQKQTTDKKIETIGNFIKGHVSSEDEYEMKKIRDVDKLVKSIKSIGKNKGSSGNTNAKGEDSSKQKQK